MSLLKPILWLVVLVLLLMGLFYVAGYSALHVPTTGTLAAPEEKGAPPPPPSAQVVAQLKASHGFQYLVSYTDQGFEPSQLTVKKGETVRFTNNASKEVWVASFGDSEYHIYPGSSSCGSSSLDTCQPLQPGEFWEFTFNESGTWNFENNLNKSQAGTVTVTVE